MDQPTPMQWKCPDQFLAEVTRAERRKAESPFYDGLIAGAIFAAVFFAGGFALLLFCVR